MKQSSKTFRNSNGSSLKILYAPFQLSNNLNTVKPVLSSHSKINKANVLKINGSLMKVESIAECSL